MRQDPYQNGPGSWVCICGEFETSPFDVFDMLSPRVLPTPPTPVLSLTHMVPTACQAPGGALVNTKQYRKAAALLKPGFWREKETVRKERHKQDHDRL